MRVSVRLRDAGPGDRDRLERLIAAYLLEFDGATERYPYLDAYWQEPERLPLLIEADGDLVGFCLIRICGDTWSVAEFSVVPPRRRSGIGRAAVEALAMRARSAGGTDLEAKVQAGQPGMRFWQAVGFTEAATSRAGVTVTRRAVAEQSRA